VPSWLSEGLSAGASCLARVDLDNGDVVMVLGQASGQTSVYESRLWLLLLLPALGGLLSGWLA
tara:strand:- start:17 stop:205 length:189 start_codon:yes stop_codon:yes gene_type:complete